MEHDPGGKVRIKLTGDVKGGAIFSSCRKYRYTLDRWMDGRKHDPYILWIGMNPSTADAEVDDPTIRREWHFTLRSGLDRMVKMNLSPYRATDPKSLPPAAGEHLSQIVTNSGMIEDIAADAKIVVAAWGVPPRQLRGWDVTVGHIIRKFKPVCLSRTKAGHPRHPLYVAGATPFEEFT